MISEIIAVVLGYLLGSIPTAYIVTRLTTGKDIRQVGGGNVDGLNTFREVGAKPAPHSPKTYPNVVLLHS